MAFRRRTKSYPLFSQEFVIHNHADIGFCLVLCVLIGLMFETVRPCTTTMALRTWSQSCSTSSSPSSCTLWFKSTF
uniref:Translocation associated membrane protein 2 n=1 Tax=Rhinopithecus bieti TaxID=61621 RepID=A0A2K6MR24_RHIBE